MYEQYALWIALILILVGALILSSMKNLSYWKALRTIHVKISEVRGTDADKTSIKASVHWVATQLEEHVLPFLDNIRLKEKIKDEE